MGVVMLHFFVSKILAEIVGFQMLHSEIEWKEENYDTEVEDENDES
jgi:hypothetical protein